MCMELLFHRKRSKIWDSSTFSLKTQGHWDPERLCDSPKLTQLGRSWVKSRGEDPFLGSSSMSFSPSCTTSHWFTPIPTACQFDVRSCLPRAESMSHFHFSRDTWHRGSPGAIILGGFLMAACMLLILQRVLLNQGIFPKPSLKAVHWCVASLF